MGYIKLRAYTRKTYDLGNSIEVEKTHSSKYGKNKATSKKIKKHNYKLAGDKLRREINANFRKNDLHIILTYKQNKRPSPFKAADDVRKLFRKIRKGYKKQGKELKYIWVCGHKDKDGTEGEDIYHKENAIHHHCVLQSTARNKIKGEQKLC